LFNNVPALLLLGYKLCFVTLNKMVINQQKQNGLTCKKYYSAVGNLTELWKNFPIKHKLKAAAVVV